MIDIEKLGHAEGFVARYLELDVEEGRRGSDKAVIQFQIVSEALTLYRQEIRNLENKILLMKHALE